MSGMGIPEEDMADYYKGVDDDAAWSESESAAAMDRAEAEAEAEAEQGEGR